MLDPDRINGSLQSSQQDSRASFSIGRFAESRFANPLCSP